MYANHENIRVKTLAAEFYSEQFGGIVVAFVSRVVHIPYSIRYRGSEYEGKQTNRRTHTFQPPYMCLPQLKRFSAYLPVIKQLKKWREEKKVNYVCTRKP